MIDKQRHRLNPIHINAVRKVFAEEGLAVYSRNNEAGLASSQVVETYSTARLVQTRYN